MVSKNKKVNYWMLFRFLDPLAPHSFEEETMDMNIDCNDEKIMRNFIRRRVLPEFKSFSGETKVIVHDTLQYYMSFLPEWLEHAFRDNQPAIYLPERPFDFFLWLWEEVFPGEDYKIEASSKDDFTIDNDFEAAGGITISL